MRLAACYLQWASCQVKRCKSTTAGGPCPNQTAHVTELVRLPRASRPLGFNKKFRLANFLPALHCLHHSRVTASWSCSLPHIHHKITHPTTLPRVDESTQPAHSRALLPAQSILVPAPSKTETYWPTSAPPPPPPAKLVAQWVKLSGLDYGYQWLSGSLVAEC